MLLPVGVRAVALAAMLAVAAYHLVRLYLRRRTAALDLTHFGMAALMLAMITGGLGGRADAWVALALSVPAVWLVVRAVRGYVLDGVVGSGAAQALGCCGMVAMLGLGSRTPSASMPGMSAASGPVVAAVLLLVAMVALTAWSVAGLRGRGWPETLAGGCQALMAGTTAVMAVALL